MERSYSVNDVMQVAVKKVGIAGWQAYEWQRAEGGSVVRGCVPFGEYTRGPRKGEPRFDHPECRDHRSIIVTDADMHAAATDYEAATGNCWECKGSGKEHTGWSIDKGLTHKTCSRCGGTRKASA